MTSDSENLDEGKKNLNKKMKIREITTGSFLDGCEDTIKSRLVLHVH